MFGLKRRASSFTTQRIYDSYQDQHEGFVNIKLHYRDLTDSTNIIRIMQAIQTHESYYLAEMRHVKLSFDSPECLEDVVWSETLRGLETIRVLVIEDRTRIYQISTSEMYVGLVEIKNRK